MSKIDVLVPEIGESIVEVTLASWLVEDGAVVQEGDLLCELESDKATVELPAPSSGKLTIESSEDTDYNVGDKIGFIDTSISEPAGTSKKSATQSQGNKENKENKDNNANKVNVDNEGRNSDVASPAARKILAEKEISSSEVQGSGKDGRITKADALLAKSSTTSASSSSLGSSMSFSRELNRQPMSRLRKTISKRLVEAKNSTALLTTFNEVDMSSIMELRKKYKELFKEKHEIGLGFMSFFTKAVCIALQEIPAVGAIIDGEEIIYHSYSDVGIAVSTPKGLVVPVIKNAESLSLADIEREVVRLATKGRNGKLSIDEMKGGNFTITNGGIFGSMLSTPIINIPQSAILGMHNIVKRPVVVDDQVVIRPIMYLALSYDHRIIDGKESVTFLVRVKELLEDPSRLLLNV